MIHLFIRLLCELQSFPVRQEISPTYFALEAVDHQSLLRPFEDMKKNSAGLCRQQPPGQLIWEGAARSAIDSFVVDLEPLAHFGQPLDARLRNEAFAGWSHIEQIVTTPTRDLYQLLNQDVCGLPVLIVALETPGVVHSHRRFPVTFDLAHADLVVARRVVIAQAVPDATAHQTVGLELMYEVDQFLALLLSDVARRVEPDQADWSVVG